MSTDTVASLRAELGFTDSAFIAGLFRSKSESKNWSRDVQRYFDKISGDKASRELVKIETAVAKMGGQSKLTEGQLSNLRREIERLTAAGGKLPSSLKLPKVGPDFGAAGAAFKQDLSGLGTQLGSNLGPAGSALAALG